MIPKRNSLPFPPSNELHALDAITPNLDEMEQQREQLIRELEALDVKITQIAIETICGKKDDSQNVELYDGTLGVTKEFVQQFSPPVAQLQWSEDLDTHFRNSGESPGNVQGVRWCTGCLIDGDKFLTAGHCFDSGGGDWQRPSRNGEVISPEEIARLMHINFNFQIDPATDQPRSDDPFPIVDLLEYRMGGIDYAIVQVGRNAAGELPSQKYGTLEVANQDLTQEGAIICVIQHPQGDPKRVEAGPLKRNRNGKISYDSIDTLGGSSGSPILSSESGKVVGVHTNGGCSAFSGENYGVAIGVLRKLSNVLNGTEAIDLATLASSKNSQESSSLSNETETVDNETPIEFEDHICEAPIEEEIDDTLEAVPFPAVNVQLSKTGQGYYSYSAHREKQFGLAETIRAIENIASAWFNNHRTGPVIGIGNISVKGGGPVPPHKSHQTGLDVDFRLLRTDGARVGVRYQDLSYSRQRTQKLVNTIRSNPILRVERILCNDSGLTGVEPWPGHDDHLHVRFTK